MSDRRSPTFWVAAVVAGILALGGTTGVASFLGARTDVARAAVSHRRTPARGSAERAEPVLARPAGEAATPARHRQHEAFLLAHIPSNMAVHAGPRAGSPVVGELPDSSKYYHVALTAWIEGTARHGTWGRIQIPYQWPRRDGWIPLRGLHRAHSRVQVHVDLSKHWVTVERNGGTLAGFPAATGASYSPTPPGHYFVTDRIPFAAGGALGSFAFGISGIQPHLPAGWSGGNQLAIHGTSDPSSIGRSASAGCVRVSEVALHRLLPLLQLGTPVVIVP
jgi:lipoprotein-anchoring transpeptidase ErfK/SrfK